MKRIAITGADGYVGRHVVRSLPDQLVVRMTRRDMPGRRGEWFPFELGDPDPQLPEGVAVIIHLAADIRQALSWEMESANLRSLLRAATKHKVRFLYVSSQSAKNPVAEYGARKAAAEKMVLAAGGIVVRPGLVVGGKRPHGLAAIALRLSRFWLLPSFSRRVFVQPIHVDDLAIALVALTDAAPKQLLELGREPIAFSEYLAITAAAHSRRRPLFVPFPTAILKLIGSRARYGFRASILQAVNTLRMADDLSSLGLTHKPIQALSAPSNDATRRALLVEGLQIFRHLGIRNPMSANLKQYVRAVEAGPHPDPIDLTALARFGVVGLLARRDDQRLSALRGRVQMAFALFEYSPAGAACAMRFQPRSWLRTIAGLSLIGPAIVGDTIRTLLVNRRTAR